MLYLETYNHCIIQLTLCYCVLSDIKSIYAENTKQTFFPAVHHHHHHPLIQHLRPSSGRSSLRRLMTGGCLLRAPRDGCRAPSVYSPPRAAAGILLLTSAASSSPVLLLGLQPHSALRPPRSYLLFTLRFSAATRQKPPTTRFLTRQSTAICWRLWRTALVVV